MNTTPKYRLISFDICPYVQRSAILLHLKELPFEVDYIDLQNKPEWFLKLSPRGKVPVLEVDGKDILFESSVINEYLNETTGGTLLSPDPIKRARERAYIEFSSTLLEEMFYLMAATDKKGVDQREKAIKRLLAHLESLEQIGECFEGSRFSLVDAAFAPALTRLEMYQNHFGLPLLKDFPRVLSWGQALSNKSYVQKSEASDLVTKYTRYLKNKDSYLLQQVCS